MSKIDYMINFERTLSQAEKIQAIDTAMTNLPSLLKGKEMWQNKMHEFDVYDHTCKFVEVLKEVLAEQTGEIDLNMVAAGWLHDVGKPEVAVSKVKDGVLQQREEGKSYHDFDDHEFVGADMVRAMSPQFFVDLGLDQEKVALLVKYHFLPLKGIKMMRKTADYKTFQDSYNQLKKQLDEINEKEGHVNKDEIMLMFLADKSSQGDPATYCTDQEELFAIRKALLSDDETMEDKFLKTIYKMQKESAKNNYKYSKKGEII